MHDDRCSKRHPTLPAVQIHAGSVRIWQREEEEWLPPGSKNGLRGVPMALPAGDLNAEALWEGSSHRGMGCEIHTTQQLLLCTTSVGAWFSFNLESE